jgi:hypothetical protein
MVTAGSAIGAKPDEMRGTAVQPHLTDAVEKVTADQLWNKNTQQSNRGD